MIKFFILIFYHLKYKNKVSDFPKLVDVVISCDTADQCMSAIQYIRLYKRRYVVDKSGFGQVTDTILTRITLYLLDTIYHIEHGYHHPELNEYKRTDTYPNLNHYVNDLLSIKFKQTWKRGVPSAIAVFDE